METTQADGTGGEEVGEEGMKTNSRKLRNIPVLSEICTTEAQNPSWLKKDALPMFASMLKIHKDSEHRG